MSKLIDLIPEKELDLKLQYGTTWIDRNFLCHEDEYRLIADIVPHDWIIVNLKCEQAPQCYFFTDHRTYIGVDDYDRIYGQTGCPALRFAAKNTSHFVMPVEEFIASIKERMLEEMTFYVASIPSYEFEEVSCAFENCRNIAIFEHDGLDLRTHIKGQFSYILDLGIKYMKAKREMENGKQ